LNLASPLPTSPESAAAQPARAEEQASAAAIGALLACVYRLFKVARMYDAGHKLLADETEVAAGAIVEFCVATAADSTDLVFVGETVFVNGQMPRFSRDAYGRAMELGGLLDRCGISNLTIAKTATPSDLLAFVRVVADVLRDPTKAATLSSQTFRSVRARRLRARIGGDTAELDQSPAARVVRTYACAVVILRGFYGSFAKERAKIPAALRRVAQRIVTHAEQEPVMLVGLAAGRARERDEASIATGAALVAVLMARQLTPDRSALTSLTLAALLYDVGRQELLKSSAGDAVLDASMRTLSEDDQDRVAGSAAVGVAALDRIEPSSVPRVVIAFEAQWLRRVQRLGPPYHGKRPVSLPARILATARSFCELMAPGPYATPMAAEDAIHFLSSRANDEGERTCVKLLTGALGIFPPGTTVELNTREIGVVTSVPESPVDFSRPPIRIMYDGAGMKLDPPIDVDLARPPAEGEPERMIQRTFDADQQQAQAMRAYVLAVTGGSRARARPAPSSAPGADTIAASDSRSGKRPIDPTPGPESRSGKRPSFAHPPATIDRPAFDERPPSGVGLDSRRRAPLPDAPAVGLDSRPRVTLPSPEVELAPITPRPLEPAPTPPPQSRATAPGFDSRRASIAGIAALSERPSAPVSVAPSSIAPSSAAPPSGGPNSSRRGAWKARQAERVAVRDPRAERESDSPPRASVESVALPRQSAVPPASRPPVSRPAPVSSPAVASPSSRPAIEPTSSEPRRSRPAADFIPTPPARPALRLDAYDDIEDETPPLPETHPTPIPQAHRPAAVFSGSVKGTRKASWEEYDELVERTAPAPEKPAGGASPKMTRRATWEEAEELAKLTGDEPPEDDGI
jgi:hypothetical protein